MKRILIGSLLLLCLNFLYGATETELRPYRLINSDYLNIDLVNNEYVTKLRGNVHFFYGETEFFGDEAEIFEVQNYVVMNGNVRVFEDSLSLSAQRVEYFRITEILNLYTDVYIVEDHQDGTKRTFESDRARYNRAEQKLYSYDNTLFVDEREAATGRCNYLDYDLDSGYGYIMGEPQISFSLTDSLHIAAERIEFYRDFNRVAASFDVRTRYVIRSSELESENEESSIETDREEVTAYDVFSDFLLLFLEDDYAVFVGEPFFVSEDAEAKADRFYIYLKDDKISGATLENNCRITFAVIKGGEKTSRVEAKRIDLVFDDGRITGMEAFDDVKSFYIGDEQNDMVINDAESDNLIITFNNDNEIETIVFRGRVKGTYKFDSNITLTE